MKNDIFCKILAFLRKLEESKIAYELRHSREDAIMVKINVPGERWEVEYLEDGSIDVECFVSKGEIQDEGVIKELFARFSDGEAETQNDAVARKK